MACGNEVNIGGVIIPGRLALAPMAGVTDMAFRLICREMGAALTYTEMVSAKALVYGDRKTRALLALSEGEHPSAAQIFGSEPEVMGEAAFLAREISGADIIDINMGCPVGKVVKNGDGCALMRDPDKAARIVEEAVRRAGVPVTVKIRKGFDKGSVNAVEFARTMECAGAAAVAVHGRTRVQMYAGVADWDIIRDVAAAVSIPVMGNGDIFTGRDAKRMLDRTRAQIAMVGRGAFGNPWIFSDARNALDGKEDKSPPDIAGRIGTAARQCELSALVKGEHVAMLEARRHFAWYLRGLPDSARFKRRAVSLSTISDMRALSDEIISFYAEHKEPE